VVRRTPKLVNPHRRFLLLLALWLVAATVALSVTLAVLLQRYLYQETARVTRDGVAALFQAELPADSFGRPVTPAMYPSVNAAVQAHFGAYGIILTRFYRPDGVVTFSFIPAQVGSKQALDDSADDLREALTGATSLDVRRLAATDNLTGTARETLETYVPVRQGGRIVGVAEVYRDLTAVDASLRRMQAGILVSATLTAAALFLSLGRVYRRSTWTIRQQATDLAAAYDGTLHAFMAALDVRDRETEGHSQRVAIYANWIGRQLGLTLAALVELRQGALLHDIGKIGIPDHILGKQGPLSPAEWRIMRQHPAIGAQMLADVPFLRPAIPLVRSHHERWDGDGYPDGLYASGIPLEARIFAVADAFDAMTSDRPYRRAQPVLDARREIVRCAGGQFDPAVVGAFSAIPIETLASTQRIGRQAGTPESAAG